MCVQLQVYVIYLSHVGTFPGLPTVHVFDVDAVDIFVFCIVIMDASPLTPGSSGDESESNIGELVDQLAAYYHGVDDSEAFNPQSLFEAD